MLPSDDSQYLLIRVPQYYLQLTSGRTVIGRLVIIDRDDVHSNTSRCYEGVVSDIAEDESSNKPGGRLELRDNPGRSLTVAEMFQQSVHQR
jgi:hypothetical protein